MSASRAVLVGRLRAALVAAVLTALAFALRIVVVSDLNTGARTSVAVASVMFASLAAAIVPRERAGTRLVVRTGSAALLGLLVVLGVLSGGIQLAMGGGLVALHFVAAYVEGSLIAATTAALFVSARR